MQSPKLLSFKSETSLDFDSHAPLKKDIKTFQMFFSDHENPLQVGFVLDQKRFTPNEMNVITFNNFHCFVFASCDFIFSP